METQLAGAVAQLDQIAATPPYAVSKSGGRWRYTFAMEETGAKGADGTVGVAFDWRSDYIGRNRDAMIEKMRRAIEEDLLFEDLVLSADQKKSALAALDAEMLSLEREDVALCFMARAEGDSVKFDPDCDARALLAVDAPAMPRQRERHNPIV